MRNLNLCLHAGASKVDRQAVDLVPVPQSTHTWTPIGHNVLIDLLITQLAMLQMKIVSEAHALTRKGERYFGLFQIENCQPDNDYSMVFGLRNSHDKSFPAGICLGSGVFVCDNLAFSSEVVLGRRHTVNILRDLPRLFATAVGKLMDMRHHQDQRITAYKNTDVTDLQAHDIVCNGLRSGAINATRVPAVLEQWHTPNHDEFKPRNGWSLFNAFTEALKESSLTELPYRTQRLHGLLDIACNVQFDVTE